MKALILAIILVLVANGCSPGELTASPEARTPAPTLAPVRDPDLISIAYADGVNPKLVLASNYKAEAVGVVPAAPSYPLPLSLNDVINVQKLESGPLALNQAQKDLLRRNGFVVKPWGGEDIVQPYKTLKVADVPVFVTTDTLLHLYHIQFNEILKRIEEEDFFNRLIDLSQAMMTRSAEDYARFINPDLKEAARRNVAYFGVALALLQTPTEGYNEDQLKAEIEKWNREGRGPRQEFKPVRKVDFTVPGYVKGEVETEIKNIEKHQGFETSAIFNSPDVQNSYQEDYSQYVPRGHYTRSEALKRFFKSMMWYGRMAFFLKGGNGAIVSERDAKLATVQGALIAAQLPAVKVGAGTGHDVWNRIYAITSFFVGAADDLTPYEYLNAMKKVLGTEFEASRLADDAVLLSLKAELAQLRNPEIYGGSGVVVIQPPITKEKLYEALAATKGMRFMGQRFVPDSYMFQNLVFPAPGMFTGKGQPFTLKETQLGPIRGIPRGLDVMAVLGSARAYEILKAEGDTDYHGKDASYDSQLAGLRKQFADFTPADWNRNLYWAWLYSLMPLLDDFGEGYPSFMRTQAWRDKELNTALASWAELRHDTILFAKQSYTSGTTSMPPQPKPVVGYVEPAPAFYSRMLALTVMTRNGLAQLNTLNDSEKTRLESLERTLRRLLGISRNELEGKELNDSDYEFIRNFGENLDAIVTGVESEGKETTMVADVHTDVNSPPQVLEEGVGYVDLIVTAYKVPDGRIIVGAGPVLSYYEFKQPIAERLTDEKWKEMLKGKAPDRPKWTNSFFAK